MLDKIYKNIVQISFFILIGALSAFVEIITYKILSSTSVIPAIIPFEINYFYPVSNFISSACGIIFNYILSIKYVFKQGKHSQRKEFGYFFIISFFSMLMTWVISAFLLHHITSVICFGFCLSNLILCKIITIGLVSILNYIIKKKFIFHH